METEMTTSADNAADNANVIVPPPFLYLAALIALVVLRWLWPAPIFAVATFALYAGVALIVVALGLGFWAVITLRRAGTNVDPRKTSTAMVSAGPFGFTRNPIYVGFTLLYLGITLALNCWWGVALLVPTLVVMHVGVIRREEHYLEKKFAADYLRYKNDVARYVG
jgi:protein-S-isoprenylcysteine O-methyltransferase Ste14